MRCLLALEQRTEVVTLYEDMSKLLLSTFGVMPDQESRALYREALRTAADPYCRGLRHRGQEEQQSRHDYSNAKDGYVMVQYTAETDVL